jgi:hypothetical protein
VISVDAVNVECLALIARALRGIPGSPNARGTAEQGDQDFP